jgi:hypothetical protein
MRTSDEIFQEMKGLWETFEAEHSATTNVSNQRARKAIGEIKKLVTEYRQSSVTESKK